MRTVAKKFRRRIEPAASTVAAYCPHRRGTGHLQQLFAFAHTVCNAEDESSSAPFPTSRPRPALQSNLKTRLCASEQIPAFVARTMDVHGVHTQEKRSLIYEQS